MRQVLLDTETTGLEPAQGHRIIEICCIELLDRRKTERQLHHFINPERDIEAEAYKIHGISREQLESEPVFREIADQLIDFIRDSEVIIHNAPFDVAFINAELARLGEEWGKLGDYCRIIDSLVMAKELFPGQKNSLDALCQRYRIDNSQRELHGALLDTQILLDVYLAMTGGQSSLSLEEAVEQHSRSTRRRPRPVNPQVKLKVVEPSAEEVAAHQRMLDLIERESQAPSVWSQTVREPEPPV